MKALLKNFLSEDSGATLVEYGVALLVVIIVGGLAITTLARNTQANVNAANGVVVAR